MIFLIRYSKYDHNFYFDNFHIYIDMYILPLHWSTHNIFFYNVFFYNCIHFLPHTCCLIFSALICPLQPQFSREKRLDFFVINSVWHFPFVLILLYCDNPCIYNVYYKIINFGNIHSIILSIWTFCIYSPDFLQLKV